MDEDVKNTVTDLMGYLLYELKSRNMPVSHFNMQKLIYKIKMELGDDHELYSKLPYYWYLKGPYSDVVCEVFDDFHPKCVPIEESFLLKDNVFYNYGSLTSKFDDVKDRLDGILQNKDFFYNELDKDIYRNHAPYRFMLPYKYEIYNVAKSMESANFDVDEFMFKFFDCESKLPIEEYFNEFKSCYSNLSSNMNLIKSAGKFNEYWVELRKPIQLIWETFAMGVRVIFKDNYYNNLTEQWNSEFKNSLNNLEKAIDKTELLINSKDYSRKDYTSKQKKLLDLTLGNFGGD